VRLQHSSIPFDLEIPLDYILHGPPALPFCHVRLTASRPLPPTYPRDLRTIGDHLRKKRLDLGLLQQEVARRIGVDEASIYNWENHRSSTSLQFIPKVIAFLGYSPRLAEANTHGEKLVFVGQQLGIRQEDLARELEVDPGTLGRMERGVGTPLARHRRKVELFLDSIHKPSGAIRP